MKIIRVNVYSLDKKLQYFAETIEDKDQYFYHVNGVVIEITQYEHDMVIKNPKLYYFSTALKLHVAIQRKKEDCNFTREFN